MDRSLERRATMSVVAALRKLLVSPEPVQHAVLFPDGDDPSFRTIVDFIRGQVLEDLVRKKWLRQVGSTYEIRDRDKCQVFADSGKLLERRLSNKPGKRQAMDEAEDSIVAATERAMEFHPIAYLSDILELAKPVFGIQMRLHSVAMLESLQFRPFEAVDADGRREPMYIAPDQDLGAAVADFFGPDASLEEGGPVVVRSHKSRADLARMAAAAQEELLLGLTTRFLEGKDGVTTREVVEDGWGMEDGPGSPLASKAASVLKRFGYRASMETVDGKKAKVFRLPAPKQVAASLARDPDLDQVLDPGPSPGPVALAPVPDMGDLMKDGQFQDALERVVPDPEPRDPPEGWRPGLDAYLTGRDITSMQDVCMALFGKIPASVPVHVLSMIGRILSSEGFHTTVFGHNRIYARSPTAPMDDVRLFVKESNRAAAELFGIRPADPASSPEWMDEEDLSNLGFLEHACLSLSMGDSFPKGGLFPGHGDYEWQTRVLSDLESKGFLEKTGTRRVDTRYKMVPGAYDFLLENDLLHEVIRECRSVMRPRTKGEGLEPDESLPEETDIVEGAGGVPDGYVPIALFLEFKNSVMDVLREHVKSIRELKARVKQLERPDDGKKTDREMLSLYAEEHRSAGTEERRAKVEADIRAEFGLTIADLKGELGGSQYGYEKRSYLHANGFPALWKMVDSDGFSLRTACSVLAKAKDAAERGGKAVEEAFEAVLKEERKSSFVTRTSSGLVFRKLASRRKKVDWAGVCDSAKLVVSREAGVMDQGLKDSVLKDLQADMDVLFRQYLARVKALSELGQTQESPGDRAVAKALRILGVQAPKRGSQLDMDAVRKRFRKLAGEYHPDRNPGNQHTTKLYMQVNEAYQLLESLRKEPTDAA